MAPPLMPMNVDNIKPFFRPIFSSNNAAGKLLNIVVTYITATGNVANDLSGDRLNPTRAAHVTTNAATLTNKP